MRWISSCLLKLIMRKGFFEAKNFIVIFGLLRIAFFSCYISITFGLGTKACFIYLFWFVYKMVDSKTLKVSIGAIIKDTEMLRLVPDHLKNKKMCKHAAKKIRS